MSFASTPIERLGLTKGETQTALRCSSRSVDYALARGLLRSYRIGNRLLIESASVREFVANGGFTGKLRIVPKTAESE